MTVSARTIVDVSPELHEWAASRAAEEDITPGDLVDRALEREKRRLTGGRPLDADTKRVGKRGAAARLGAHELAGAELARACGFSVQTLGKLEALGLAAPLRAGKRGVAAAWDPAVAPVVALCGWLYDLAPGLPTERFRDIVRYIEGRESARGFFDRGRFLVVSKENVRLVVADHVAAAVHRCEDAAVVIDLSRAGAVIDNLAAADAA